MCDVAGVNQGGFCQLPQNDQTYLPIFSLSVKFCLQESHLSDQLLEGCKLLGTFGVKVATGKGKHGGGRELNL